MADIDRASYTNEDLAEIVEVQGLDYAIMHYVDFEDIVDPEMRDLFKEADEVLSKIQSLLPMIDY